MNDAALDKEERKRLEDRIANAQTGEERTAAENELKEKSEPIGALNKGSKKLDDYFGDIEKEKQKRIDNANELTDKEKAALDKKHHVERNEDGKIIRGDF